MTISIQFKYEYANSIYAKAMKIILNYISFHICTQKFKNAQTQFAI